MGRRKSAAPLSLDVRDFIMSFIDQYESADKAFRIGKVLSDDNETLLSHLSGLSNLTNINTGTQHRDIIRGITINHILLQRHIDNLNKQNSKTQRWVMVLAVAALISSIVQIFSPLLFQSPPIASKPQTPTVQLGTPIPVQPQASHQTKGSKP